MKPYKQMFGKTILEETLISLKERFPFLKDGILGSYTFKKKGRGNHRVCMLEISERMIKYDKYEDFMSIINRLKDSIIY